MSGAATCWEEVYRAQTARIAELDAENAALRAKLDDPARLHAHCVRHLTDAQVAHLFGERMTEIQNDRDRLQSENIALRELTATLGAPNHLGVPVPLYRELRADKARLDWLDDKGCWLTIPGARNFLSGASRAVIDRAMQEAKQ